jgi:hypothetical protein
LNWGIWGLGKGRPVVDLVVDWADLRPFIETFLEEGWNPLRSAWNFD